MAPHMVSRWAPASEPPTMARGSCQTCGAQHPVLLGLADGRPQPGAQAVGHDDVEQRVERLHAALVRHLAHASPSTPAFSGANVSSMISRSHTARCRRIPASSDCAPASRRRRVVGIRQRRHALGRREGEDLAPARQAVEDGAVLEAQAHLHGVGQRQRHHGRPAGGGGRPGGQLAPGAVGVHGRDAEDVPVDRSVRQQRHGGQEVDVLLAEAVQAAGDDELDRGALVLAHGGGQALHLLPGRGARGHGLAVAVVVRVHLRGGEAERALLERGVQGRLHGVDVPARRPRPRRRARP